MVISSKSDGKLYSTSLFEKGRINVIHPKHNWNAMGFWVWIIELICYANGIRFILQILLCLQVLYNKICQVMQWISKKKKRSSRNWGIIGLAGVDLENCGKTFFETQNNLHTEKKIIVNMLLWIFIFSVKYFLAFLVILLFNLKFFQTANS